MAIEIVDFPIQNGGSFHGKMLVHQRVYHGTSWKLMDIDGNLWTLMGNFIGSKTKNCPKFGSENGVYPVYPKDIAI